MHLKDGSIDLQKPRTKSTGLSRRFADDDYQVLAHFAGQRAGELRTQDGEACAGQTELIRNAPTFRDQEVHIHTRCPAHVQWPEFTRTCALATVRLSLKLILCH